jgi:hypothetical protein
MRKLTAVAAFAFVLLTLPAEARSPTRDLARGRIVEPDQRTIRFNARSQADGTRARGRITVDFRPDERVVERFRVTCLAVSGNRATVIGQLERVKPKKFPTAVTGIVLWLADNDAAGAPDRYEYQLLTTRNAVCQPIAAPFFPVTRGKIKIRDAS